MYIACIKSLVCSGHNVLCLDHGNLGDRVEFCCLVWTLLSLILFHFFLSYYNIIYLNSGQCSIVSYCLIEYSLDSVVLGWFLS